jgi:putative ABC transport system permease protein
MLASLLLSRLLASLMYETSVTDPPSFLSAGLLLLLTALLACLVPALRAAHTDPQAALRDE